jgi:hypothetical protein
MDTSAKVRENRLRRVATRRGYRLVRNPRRDPRAFDYGSYQLIDPATNTCVADFGWDQPSSGDHLDEVEAWLAKV